MQQQSAEFEAGVASQARTASGRLWPHVAVSSSTSSGGQGLPRCQASYQGAEDGLLLSLR
eukprot:1149916-Pelagomonas_calceolata.AAC.2